MAGTSLATAASERLRELARRLNEHEGFADVVSALSRGQPATLDGVWGSSCALVAAELARMAAGPLVVVCPHQDEIDTFCDDFALFSSVVAKRFPAWESEPGERILHDEIHAERLRTLKQLVRAAGPDPAVPRAVPAAAGSEPAASVLPAAARD